MNIFKKILKELTESKFELVPADPKDKKVPDYMSALINWKIVQSKSDKHPEFGYPMGQILCRNLEEAEDHIKNSEFKDSYMNDYGCDESVTK